MAAHQARGSGPPSRPRRPAGPGGGRFTAFEHAEPAGLIDDSPPDDSAAGSVTAGCAGLDSGNLNVAGLGPGGQPDAVAACQPAAPGEKARFLAADQPAGVRLAAVVSPACPRLTALAAAGALEPGVRALAVLSPHLDEATRLRLASDPEVLRAVASVTGDDPVAA